MLGEPLIFLLPQPPPSCLYAGSLTGFSRVFLLFQLSLQDLQGEFGCLGLFQVITPAFSGLLMVLRPLPSPPLRVSPVALSILLCLIINQDLCLGDSAKSYLLPYIVSIHPDSPFFCLWDSTPVWSSPRPELSASSPSTVLPRMTSTCDLSQGWSWMEIPH